MFENFRSSLPAPCSSVPIWLVLDLMPRRGAGHQSGYRQTSNGVHMFEYDQAIVQTLLTESNEFQYLHKRHDDLKDKVRKAELGDLPLDDKTLVSMKKEKLLAKDKMAAMIDNFRRENAVA